MTPWTAASGTVYKLCLLDTNIVSDCLKNRDGEGRNLLQYYISKGHAPCFTFHTLVELRRRSDLFHSFLHTFSAIPWFLMKPWGLVELEEADGAIGAMLSPILNSFSTSGSDSSYDAKYFFEQYETDASLKNIEDTWRSEEEYGLEVLEKLGGVFGHSCREANAHDAQRFLEFGSARLLRRPEVPLDSRPSAKTYLFSIYYRLFGPKELKPGEMTDVRIAALAPYVDVFCTENFQATVFEKIRHLIPELGDLEVVRLRDLRD